MSDKSLKSSKEYGFSHDHIWRAIDNLAAAFKYSPSGLAKQAGLDPTAFNKSKRVSPDGKPRWPSTESIAQILAATGASMEDFSSLMGENPALLKTAKAKGKKTDIHKNVAKLLLDTKSVLVNTKDPFLYTSGKRGPVYVDMRRLMSFPQERTIVMDHAAALLKKEGFDYIAGGETAGIPYAAFIAERLKKPMLYIRKKPKGHGRMAQIEGHMEEGTPKVLIVEDLQNRGTSQKVFIEAAREAGAVVEDVFVIFAYNIYDFDKDRDTTLHHLTDWWAVLDVIKDEQYFDHETITSLESFLNDPESWMNSYEQSGAA